MNKHIIRTSLVTAVFLLITAVSTNAFAVEVARYYSRGYYPPPPPRIVQYHVPHHAGYVPYYHSAPYYPAYRRSGYYGPRPAAVTPHGIYFRKPGIGIYF